MSTVPPAPDRAQATRSRLLRRPEPGWFSLLLLLLMLALVGISIAEARPLLIAGGNVSPSLVPLMVAAGLVGFVLARSSLGVVRAHILGAILAAALLLLVTAAAVSGSSSVLVTSWSELEARMAQLYGVLQGSMAGPDADASSLPTSATFLLLGAICWSTGQFAAFSVFRYERAGPAVMATGVLLFLNVALRALEPAVEPLALLVELAVFSVLAMLLLLRLQLVQQGRQWARRNIADTGEVARLFLRTGALFVAFTVAGATSLTLVAAAPPPQLDAGALEDGLGGLGDEIADILDRLGLAPERGPRTSFGDEVTISDRWNLGEGIAFTALVDGDLRGNYWWGAAYSDFDGRAWEADTTSELALGLDEPLLLGDADSGGRILLATSILPQASSIARGTVLGPSETYTVDRDTRVETIGGGVAEITFADPLDRGVAYGVESLVGDYAFQSETFTATELAAAGTAYPDWVREHYLEVEPGTIGRQTRELVASLEDNARRDDRDTPYEKAFELQRFLRSMDYTTDIRGECGTLGVAECLLFLRKGFCQHFATTMVLALREMDIPARYVNGYLPGSTAGDGAWTVPEQALHAWVEVYFPGHGWVRFDPTPGLRLRDLGQEQTRFAAGDPDRGQGSEPEPPEPEATEPADPIAEPTPEPSPIAQELPPGPTDDGSGQAALFAALAVGGVTALIMATLLGLLWFRLRRGPADGSVAYRGVVRIATRLGYPPHPSQTEYEYAASLSEVVPSVRPELYLVAGARVATAYGQQSLSGERLPAMRRAYGRVRRALLRLVLRRGR